MEIKLVCTNCNRELATDLSLDGDDAILEIYPCSKCLKRSRDEGWRDGVAKYLEEKGED